MGMLERWDRRNQRSAEWQNEVGRPNPNPRYGRTIGVVFVGMCVLSIARRLVVPPIGAGAWLALVVVFGGMCSGIAIAQQNRQLREWEKSRT
jgi:hypothetical protein